MDYRLHQCQAKQNRGKKLERDCQTLKDYLAGHEGIILESDKPIAPLTTMKVGGPARLYFKSTNPGELAVVIKKAKEFGIDWIVIGAGSNILVMDSGYDGLVIQLGEGFDRISFDGRRCTAGAAVRLTRVIDECAKRSLGDLTFLTGIPATVGGAVAGNAGAHGIEISKYLSYVYLIDHQGNILTLKKDDIDFSYRHSSLKGMGVITGAEFVLDEIAGNILASRRNEYLDQRAGQPTSKMSAGCIFKNPEGETAGYLIEAAGLKGKRIGGAVISEQHGNYFINDRDATAADILNLIDLTRKEVASRTGIELELEVQVIGS